MKKISFVFFVLFTLTLVPLEAAPEGFLFGQDKPSRLIVNNRVLAKVNGNAISVIDVMKKMDVIFYRQFPEYVSSPEARFQFYQVNWKSVLEELINKELVLADATENKLPVTNGDIRQEMETLFGPNIITNLDKVGLSFDEAWKIVQGDITLRRMIGARVNNKALKDVTPQDVKAAYDKLSQENIQPDRWKYSVISIRDKNETVGASTANAINQLLEEGTAPSEIVEKLKAEHLLPVTTTVNISEEYAHTEKEMSPAYKTILADMQAGSFSKPIPQQSRADRSTVFRIFFLKEKITGGVVPFAEVENKIKDHLLDEKIAVETEAYIKRLRKHFDIQNPDLPEDFEPFSIKKAL